MSCCDKYGECSQSDTCPIRTGIVLPHQARCARHQVARIKSSRPAWLDGGAQGVAQHDSDEDDDGVTAMEYVMAAVLAVSVAIAVGAAFAAIVQVLR